MDDCLNEKSGKELAGSIAARANVKLHECYQCGKCTAGCPMAHAMDIMPRELVHYMQLGMTEEILASKSIWLCASCHTCVERCPHSIDIPSLMELSRQAAKARGKIGVKTVDMFSSIFMQNVKMFGKSHEVLLEGMYNMTTGRFMQDMDSVPHMLKNKLVGIEPHTTNHPEEIKAIIEKALERGGEEE